MGLGGLSTSFVWIVASFESIGTATIVLCVDTWEHHFDHVLCFFGSHRWQQFKRDRKLAIGLVFCIVWFDHGFCIAKNRFLFIELEIETNGGQVTVFFVLLLLLLLLPSFQYEFCNCSKPKKNSTVENTGTFMG